jgi:dTDP-L-rhamnose 4-epimerase
VRIFDNLTEQVHHGKVPEYLARNVEFFSGDMRDEDAVRQAIAGIDVVYHLAAAVGVGQSMYEISHYMGANTMGTSVLLQSLLGSRPQVRKLVVASSMSIYGEGMGLCAACGEVLPTQRTAEQLKDKQWELRCATCDGDLVPLPTPESKPLQASSVYALSKKDQEELCLLYGRTYGLPVVALRFFNIYGTRQALSNPYTGVAANFASRLLNGNAPMIFEDGRQMRDFVSVHDVVEACTLAMERDGADGYALNVGSGVPISIREVARILGQALGIDYPAEITGRYRAGDIRHCFGDITRARRLLGYEPQVKFAEGVKELVAWLRSQRAEDRADQMVSKLAAFGLTA